MTSQKLLNYRYVVQLVLLFGLEVVQTVKSSTAMAWTNERPLNVVVAVVLASFLVGSVVATSFDLDSRVRARLNQVVVGVFCLQTVLVCTVSFLTAQTLMPAEEIAQLFYTPPGATLRVLALAEGASLSLASLAMWNVLAEVWRKEIEARASQTARLVELDGLRNRSRGGA